MWLCMHNVPKIPSLQYLKKRVGNKFDLLSFLQADTIVFVGSAKYISRKKWRFKLIFLLADKHQTFLQYDAINFGSSASHAQSTQSNKFASKTTAVSQEKI